MPENAAPVVGTASGPVRGLTRDGVAAFLGIPYAEPPVGELRFRHPEPYVGTVGVIDATGFGPAAPQPPSRLEASLGPMGLPGQDEDCLNLNIWAVARPGEAATRPVLVWLHGGGFLAGAGSQPWFDGIRLAREHDLVVVTLNYRLGALGFLYLPGPADHPPVANLGIRDQVAALRWVRANIAGFGGDPDRVTLAGQSAGGQSVLALLNRYDPAEPLYHRAVRTHRFTWYPEGGPLRAAHCSELPFEFDNVDSWRDSLLLRGAADDALAEQVRVVQRQFMPW